MTNRTIKRTLIIVGTSAILLVLIIAGLRVSFGFTRDSLLLPNFARARGTGNEMMELRFQDTDTHELLVTGNTLMLSPNHSEGDSPLDYGSVFVSNDKDLNVEGYPDGTTKNWQSNGSSSTLNIPLESSVEYAVLLWGGTYQSAHDPSNTIKDKINSPVIFTTPNGDHLVSPDMVNGYTYSINYDLRDTEYGYYINSQNVTELVSQSGGGEFALSGIPAILDSPYNTIKKQLTSPENSAGWSLLVVHKNKQLPINTISIMTGILPSRDKASIDDYLVINSSPIQENKPTNVSINLVASEGDGNRSGDQVLFGGPTTGMQPIETQFNPRNNFFGSQILDTQNIPNTQSTFGNLNSNLSSTEPMKRQGWDITSVDVTDNIRGNQNEFHLYPLSEDDQYYIHAIGFSAELDKAQVEASFESQEDRIIAVLKNTGSLQIDSLKIKSQPNDEISWVQVITKLTEYPQEKILLGDESIVVSDIPEGSSISFSLNVDSTINHSWPLRYSYTQSDGSLVQIETSLTYVPESKTTVRRDTSKNAAPIILDDIAFTTVNKEVVVDITKNDSDLDGTIDLTTLSIVQEPEFGSAELLEDGTLRYLPKTGYSGTDKIIYELCDNLKSCKNGSVVISIESLVDDEEVTFHGSRIMRAVTSIIFYSHRFTFNGMGGVNAYAQSNENTQILNPDSTETTSGNAIKIPVLSNDNISNPSQYSISVSKAPENGTISVEDNKLNYTPSETFLGTEYLVYSVCDSTGQCYTAPVTISVVKPSNGLFSARPTQIPDTFSGFEFSRTLLTGLLIVVGIFVVYSIKIYYDEHHHQLALLETAESESRH